MSRWGGLPLTVVLTLLLDLGAKRIGVYEALVYTTPPRRCKTGAHIHQKKGRTCKTGAHIHQRSAYTPIDFPSCKNARQFLRIGRVNSEVMSAQKTLAKDTPQSHGEAKWLPEDALGVPKDFFGVPWVALRMP